MQDNYKNKEMIDEGWAQMNQILDREMPVASKGRRLLWFWLLPAFLLIGVSTGYALYHYQSQGDDKSDQLDQRVEVRDKIPMAQFEEHDIEEENSTQQDESLIVGLNANEEQPAAATKQIAQITSISHDKNVDSNQTSSSKSVNSAVQQEALVLAETPVFSNSEKMKEEPTFIQNDVIVSNDVNRADEQISNTATATHESRMSSQMRDMVSIVVPPAYQQEERNTLAINPLPTIESPSEISKNTILDRLNTKDFSQSVLVNKSKSRFQIAALGMLRVNSDIGLRGVGAGIELGYQLTPSLRLYSGLQYDFHKEGNIANLNANSRANADQLAIEEVYSDPSGFLSFGKDNDQQTVAVTSSEVVNSEIKILSESFHYLHLPIGLEKKLTRKLAIRGGAKLSYLFSAPSKYPVEIRNPIAGLTIYNSANRNTLLDEGFIQNVDVAATLGVSFYLNRRLAIDASYDHGFVPIYDGADDEIANMDNNSLLGRSTSNDFNRLFTLGLRYSFSRL